MRAFKASEGVETKHITKEKELLDEFNKLLKFVEQHCYASQSTKQAVKYIRKAHKMLKVKK